MEVLPFSITNLLRDRIPEGSRVEFKSTWDDNIRAAAVRTICAFANDFQNINGGYIILGVSETGGKPELPPRGLDDLNLESIQQKVREACEHLEPKYMPILQPERFEEKKLLVIWCPPGDVRPYTAPVSLKRKGEEQHDKGRNYYVRIGSETIVAKGPILNQLLEQTAKVPFDDRLARGIPIHTITESHVRSYLRDVGSRLDTDPPLPLGDILKQLRLLAPSNGSMALRNIALLLFADDPEKYFPGARIDVVQFGDDGDLILEHKIVGPIQDQIRTSMRYLDNLLGTLNRKIPGQLEVIRTVPFPFEAMEEAIANAVLHRSYDGVPEATKIYLRPDRMEITSYPGPVPGLDRSHFLAGASPPPVPLRNRRVGDFLKELKLVEARGTGVSTIHRKMRANGSPEARFEFDDSRTYFRVILPAHPEYVVLHAIREAGHFWARGDRERAISHLDAEVKRGYPSGVLFAQYIEYLCSVGDYWVGQRALDDFAKLPTATQRHLPFLAMAKGYLDHDKLAEARKVMAVVPLASSPSDRLEVAILAKRAGMISEAHSRFESLLDSIQTDPKALHEFAQTKIQLAMKLARSKGDHSEAKRRLNGEALSLIRRVVQLSHDQPVRRAWAYYDLAKLLKYLKSPTSEIAFEIDSAIEAMPNEYRFQDWKRANLRSSH